MDTALFIVVDELPEVGLENKIYLLDTGSAGVDEYVYVEGEWHRMGEMTLDLSNYTTTEEVEQMIKSKGYLTEESDPTVPKHVKGITEDDINSWNNKVDEESDPTVPQHVKNIKETDISNWNNKLDNEEDPTVPEHVKNITKNDINKWNKDEEDPTVPQHVKDITEQNISDWNKSILNKYTIKITTDIVLEYTDMTYAKITKHIENNEPFVCYLEYGIQKFEMSLMRISEYEGVTYYEFMSTVRNGINQLIFWFYIREDETTQIELVTDAPMVFHAELNDDGTLKSLDATYDQILHAMNSGKDVLLKTTWIGETIHMNLGEWKAAYTPKYFSFYGVVRNGLQMHEFFIHVGEGGEHTFSDVRTYQMKDEQVQSVVANSTNESTYPSTAAIFKEYQRKPDIVYNDSTGFEASNSDIGDDWHLTGLNLSPYKRLKIYVKPNGSSNDNWSPAHIVELHLDDRAKGVSNAFVTSHAALNPNNRNRIHYVTFAVNSEKTAVQFVAANSLYGTASTNASGGRTCYLIEGYYD
jgi:hypothetical protein